MIIKKINDNLSITGEVYSNRKAWGHEVKAIYNGQEVEQNRVRYYNRTWERYCFETAWLGLVDKLDASGVLPLRDRLELYKAINA